jgi:hypothetical protein
MADTGTRLSIDIWHTSVAAVVRTSDGQEHPLAFDGSQMLPFVVAVTDTGALHPGAWGEAIGAEYPGLYVRTPAQRLFDDRVQVGGVSVDPVDLVAAVLSRVAQEARTVTGGTVPEDVVFCTPCGWVSRQWMRVAVAADRAGLAPPRQLGAAEAIVRDRMAAGAAVPVGAVVVVCRLDATVGELVLLHRRADGFEQRASMTFGELAEIPGSSLPEQAATALSEALAVNRLTGDEITAVFCHVAEESFPTLSAVLTVSAGLVVGPVRVNGLAAARGGMHSTVPNKPVRPAWRWARLAHSVAGTAIGWSAAIFVAYQLFNSGMVYEATSISPKMLVTRWCGWGLAAVFALLGLASAAVMTSDVRALRSGTAEPVDGPDPKLSSALLFAAGLGLGVAAVFALVGGAHFGLAPLPILTWTLGSTVVLAAVVAIVGLLAGRLPMKRGWPDRLRFPVEASALATVSTVSVIGSYVGIPLGDRDVWWSMEHGGAIGIGLAVAWLVAPAPWSSTPDAVRRWFRLLIVGALFGGPATYAIDIETFDAIGAFLIGAVTVWWVVRLARIVGPMLRTLLANSGPPQPSARAAGTEESASAGAPTSTG